MVPSYSQRLHLQVRTGPLAGADMRIVGRGGDAPVAQGCLDQADGGTIFLSMTGMGVAHPVRGDLCAQPGAGGCLFDHAPDRCPVKLATAGAKRMKHRTVVWRILAAGHKFLPRLCVQEHMARLAPFAEDRQLASLPMGLDMAPLQVTQLR